MPVKLHHLLYRFRITFYIGATVFLASLAKSNGAILVGQNGINNTATVIDFAVTPVVADWATAGVVGGANTIQTVAEMDTKVQAMTTAGIATSLPVSNPNDYSVDDLYHYQQVAQHVSSAPKSKAANLLLATLNNNSGSTITGFDALYDLGFVSTVAEELPGLYMYYSTTGLVNSWVSLGVDTIAGAQTATITPGGGWLSGTNLYLLWADDNATGNTTDSVATVDNFQISGVVPEPGRAALLMFASALLFLRRRR